jgi:predicted transcriptional regulator
MSTHIQSADFSAFKQFQSFSSVEDMNMAIRRFLYTYKHELTPSIVDVLKTISRYSCKLVGVCFTKIDTLSLQANVSRSTVERAIRTLKQYGVLKVQRTQRKVGGFGHNVYIICPIDVSVKASDLKCRDDAETPTETSTEGKIPLSETKSYKTKHSDRDKRINVDGSSNRTIDYSYLPDYIHQDFISATQPFISPSETYSLWGKVNMAYNASKLSQPLELVIDKVISAFKQSIFAQKMNRIQSTFNGYFYRTLENMLIVEKRREVAANMYNWLDPGDDVRPQY